MILDLNLLFTQFCFQSLKLADFGLAVVVREPLFTVCGTPTYVAPEILAETGYGVKVSRDYPDISKASHQWVTSSGRCLGGGSHPLHSSLRVSAVFQSDKQPRGTLRPNPLWSVRVQFPRLGRYLLSRQGADLLVASGRPPAEILSQGDSSASLDSEPGK